MIQDTLITAIQQRGLDPAAYPQGQLLGSGAYSLVFPHSEQARVIKVTVCPASTPLLTHLIEAPQKDYVRVFEKYDLSLLLETAFPVTAFVLERLEPLPASLVEDFTVVAKEACVQALGGAARPPKRGQPGYADFNVRYCEQLARQDSARETAWLFLAEHLEACANDHQSVDVLTEGNLLARQGQLVISDPLRIVQIR